VNPAAVVAFNFKTVYRKPFHKQRSESCSSIYLNFLIVYRNSLHQLGNESRAAVVTLKLIIDHRKPVVSWVVNPEAVVATF
jgi:hypothetical protein